MGQLDLALGGLDRAGEGALLIAEQLRLEQILGNGRAVDRDEAAHRGAGWPGGRRGRAIPCRCREAPSSITETSVLATRSMVRATLAISGAAVIIVPSTVRSSPTLLLEPAVLVLELVELEGAAHDQAELIDIDRLLVEIIGARRDRPERAFARAVAGGDDHLGLGLERQDRLQRGEAFGDAVRIGRQAEIERHHRRLRRADEIDRAHCGPRRPAPHNRHRPSGAGAAAPRRPRRSAAWASRAGIHARFRSNGSRPGSRRRAGTG